MYILRTSISLTAAFCLALIPAAQGAEPKSPNEGRSVPAAPGGVSAEAATVPPYELIYTPIAPCRAFGAQSVVKNVAKTFQITGSTGFSAQGGPSTGCGIPKSAKAVSVTLTANTPAASSYLIAYASGSSSPSIVSVRYQNAIPAASGSIVALGSDGRMAIYSGAATKAFGDVTGYFAPAIHAVIAYSGDILTGSERVIGSIKRGTGAYRVEIDRPLAGCTPIASMNGSAYIASAYISGEYVYANTYRLDGTSIDLYWALSVHC